MTVVTPGLALALIGAGTAVGMAAVGSGIGVGIAGATGAGVAAVRPEKFGKALVFQAVPQTQGIYGLLVAILILLSTGIIGGTGEEISVASGLAALGAGIAAGISGLSAIGQGIAASSGIAATAQRDEALGRSLVFSVIPETQAIYGLLVAILILAFSGLLSGSPVATTATGLAAVGCGLAVGLAGLSAIGQGIAASGGIAAASEKQEMFGKALVFSVIPETQAIYRNSPYDIYRNCHRKPGIRCLAWNCGSWLRSCCRSCCNICNRSGYRFCGRDSRNSRERLHVW
jgi:V/A-type H+-transporting ATPase subunit K